MTGRHGPSGAHRTTAAAPASRTTAAPMTRAPHSPKPAPDPKAPGVTGGTEPSHAETCPNCKGTKMEPTGGTCQGCGPDGNVRVVGDADHGADSLHGVPSHGGPAADPALSGGAGQNASTPAGTGAEPTGADVMGY